MTTTRPPNPSSRRVAAALPPARPPPTITIGLPPSRADTERILPAQSGDREADRPVSRPEPALIWPGYDARDDTGAIGAASATRPKVEDQLVIFRFLARA